MTTLTHPVALVSLALLLGVGLALLLAAERQRRRRRALRLQERRLAAMCHELRTPLNAIAGTVPLLQHGSSSARDRALAVLSRNVRIESALIDELLGASDVLAGRAPAAAADTGPSRRRQDGAVTDRPGAFLFLRGDQQHGAGD